MFIPCFIGTAVCWFIAKDPERVWYAVSGWQYENEEANVPSTGVFLIQSAVLGTLGLVLLFFGASDLYMTLKR